MSRSEQELSDIRVRLREFHAKKDRLNSDDGAQKNDIERYKKVMTAISDHEIIAGESEGLNRVKNFAFIAGLVSLAKRKIITNSSENEINLFSEPYPLIMDALFSNAEPVMNERVGRKYYLNTISETYTRLN